MVRNKLRKHNLNNGYLLILYNFSLIRNNIINFLLSSSEKITPKDKSKNVIIPERSKKPNKLKPSLISIQSMIFRGRMDHDLIEHICVCAVPRKLPVRTEQVELPRSCSVRYLGKGQRPERRKMSYIASTY